MNLMMILEMANSAFADRIAFTNSEDGSSITYQELFDQSGSAALAAQGTTSDHFAIRDVNSLAMPIGIFASSWAGLPFVPLNYRLTEAEIEALLTRITPTYLVTHDDHEEVYTNREGITPVTRGAFLENFDAQSKPEDAWSMEPEDVAVLLFTSGTTGEPKAAILRQKHLVSYLLGSVEFASAEEHEAALVCVPPYHIAGIMAVLSSVYSGRRVVQLPQFSAEAWLELAKSEKITTAFVVPTMLSKIIEALDGQSTADLPDLGSLSYGGGKMPLPVLERAMALFPDTEFTNAYGLTETSSTISVLGPEEHRTAAASEDKYARRRLVSVGVPMPGIEIEIRDDDNNVLPIDTAGEIFVRGEQVSGEYRGIGKVSSEDGWFPTRDRGYTDSEGYLFLDGRADDVIVRGGENLSPGEIEDVLLQHKAVADVAIVGIPDEQWGEAVAMAVVLKPGTSASEDELRSWVKDRLRSSRVPQVIHYKDELPYNPTGKLLRRVIREELIA
ncbi:MAG: acyl--CoA ligase [Pseudomonadales bacterium]|nr:acyl--CoA ligase [Pseudomonadales bacterium]